jgi:hypothetical protein
MGMGNIVAILNILTSREAVFWTIIYMEGVYDHNRVTYDSGTGWKKMNSRLAGKGDLGTALECARNSYIRIKTF